MSGLRPCDENLGASERPNIVQKMNLHDAVAIDDTVGLNETRTGCQASAEA
eukprot:CAMPEP_0206506318 /NCGR_PEP_ID=MMETSP0324_2-20121206/56694_1 /ASSEMBLY_ACC=CAM_ASM_000836 /TAXON_ID=2866 /ORGANISM="Crypthecodinium cohnii, Strain Seligo" /LENGTH=50 /DNA_ID=CAMNT_0053996025 /DNA_START=17 /DNA_END=166 /DNA_ORIENTATION=-